MTVILEDNSFDSDNNVGTNIEDIDDGYFIEGGKDLINPEEDGDELSKNSPNTLNVINCSAFIQ